MGQVMTSLDHNARLRSSNMTKLLMQQRRSSVRLARWRNSYVNLKKLIAKNARLIRIAAICLLVGLSFGVISSLTLTFLSVANIQKSKPVASDLVTTPNATVAPVVPATKTDGPPISTPVAASGDETNPSLKLSTDLSLTHPFEGNKP
jgi:hypothetical protein